VAVVAIQKFENGYVTIELSPFQCANLAKACQFASEQSCEAEIEFWRTLADLFHACTVAGFAQWHMSSPDLEALFEQLAMLNLGRNNNDTPKNGLNGHKH
jgi:hypothetical protein